MTYDEGVAHCAASGSTLAAIYDTSELAAARAAISAAGVEKAITSASSDGSGWAWHGTERWEEGGFPLNTGQVTDQREGMAGHIYSLHRSEDGFVWDADGRDERHPVLCRLSPPPPSQFTLFTVQLSWDAAQQDCQARGGDLATIHGDEDNAEVLRLLQTQQDAGTWPTNNGYGGAWIGLTDSTQENTFIWAGSGAVATYFNWGSGEPNNAHEDCVTMWEEDMWGRLKGTWNDDDCSAVHPYVCSLPPSPPTLFVVRPSPLELSPRHRPAPPLSRLRRYPLPPPLSPAPTPGDDCPSACTARRSPPSP